MAQVFPRSANTVARATLVAIVLVTLLISAAGFLYVRSPWFTLVDVPREQPIPFSHKHHVNDDGLDCRYCHTSVEVSPYAGMPDTKTCMNCHSQIFAQSPLLAPLRESFQTGQPLHWTRVNNLPDFVYFDHSIHVNKGIGCSSCHGRVDQMPLTAKGSDLAMGFCINCHLHPELQVRPLDQVFNQAWQPPPNQAEVGAQLVKEYQIQDKTSCSTCHR